MTSGVIQPARPEPASSPAGPVAAAGPAPTVGDSPPGPPPVARAAPRPPGSRPSRPLRRGVLPARGRLRARHLRGGDRQQPLPAPARCGRRVLRLAGRAPDGTVARADRVVLAGRLVRRVLPRRRALPRDEDRTPRRARRRLGRRRGVPPQLPARVRGPRRDALAPAGGRRPRGVPARRVDRRPRRGDGRVARVRHPGPAAARVHRGGDRRPRVRGRRLGAPPRPDPGRRRAVARVRRGGRSRSSPRRSPCASARTRSSGTTC